MGSRRGIEINKPDNDQIRDILYAKKSGLENKICKFMQEVWKQANIPASCTCPPYN